MDTIELTHSLFSTEENFVVDNTEFEMEHYLVQTEAFLVENENIYGKFTDVQEGILGDIWYVIKDIAKKAVQFVIWLWKSMIKFIKKVIHKIAVWLGFSEEDKKNPAAAKARMKQKAAKPVEIPIITMESASIIKKKVYSKEEMRNHVLKEMKKITREIDRLSKKEIEYTKELERYSEKVKPANESFNAVEEAKIYHGRRIIDPNNAMQDVIDVNGKGSLDDRTVDFIKHESGDIYTEISATDRISGLQYYRNQDVNMASHERVLKSEDVVKAYNQLIACHFEDDSVMQNYLKQIKSLNIGLDEKTIISFLKDNYYESCENDPEKIKTLCKLRINYNKRLIQMLQTIVKLNVNLLHLGAYEIEKANAEPEILRGFLDRVSYNDLKQYKIRDGFYDFRPLSKEWSEGNKIPNARPGCLFHTDHAFRDEKYEEEGEIVRLFQTCMKYDAVVMAHGGYTELSDGHERKQFKKYTPFNRYKELLKESRRYWKACLVSGSLFLMPKLEEALRSGKYKRSDYGGNVTVSSPLMSGGNDYDMGDDERDFVTVNGKRYMKTQP